MRRLMRSNGELAQGQKASEILADTSLYGDVLYLIRNGERTVQRRRSREQEHVQREKMCSFDDGSVQPGSWAEHRSEANSPAKELEQLLSALQPPAVPDRGPHTHSILTEFNLGARSLLELVLHAACVRPAVEATPPLVDARLLQAPGGYILPIANYQHKVGQKVTLRIRTEDKITKVTSASHGELAVKEDDGRIVLTIPALGYGDVLRLE